MAQTAANFHAILKNIYIDPMMDQMRKDINRQIYGLNIDYSFYSKHLVIKGNKEFIVSSEALWGRQGIS